LTIFALRTGEEVGCVVYRLGVSTIVASESVVVAMISEADVAIRAFGYISTLWAFHIRGKTATILE
jgi:hypothetical protein